MKVLSLAAALAFAATGALAQDAPAFFSETYPDHALGPALQWYGALSNEEAELDTLTRELVMVGVSAQIPCAYCVHAHVRNARLAGATEGQIREAVAAAGAVRMWSTVFHGMAYDLDAFKEEFDRMRPLPGKE